MKNYRFLQTAFLLLVLSLSLQGCLGIGGNGTTNNNNFNTTGTNGSNIGINNTDQAVFKGKIYFTLNHNLYMLDGTRTPQQLTRNMTVVDPAISPDGKWIAFVVRFQNYSNLVYMSTNRGPIHTVVTGDGQFYPGGDGKNNFYWFMQPSWSPDSKNLLFLSDLQKEFYWGALGNPFNVAYFSDLQVFSLPIGRATLTALQVIHGNMAQAIAYASYGDGGDRDAAYRPNHNNQIVYTHYQYDTTAHTQQIIQIFMEDPNAIVNNPGVYNPDSDPGIAITPPDTNMQSMQPTFSPDGNSLAYIRRQDSTHLGLYVMPVPTQNITQNPNNAATEQQALQSFKKSVLLQSAQYISQPFWSPDGKQIGYLSYSNSVFDIWLQNVTIDKTGVYKTVGTAVQLTSANGQLDGETRPTWTV